MPGDARFALNGRDRFRGVAYLSHVSVYFSAGFVSVYPSGVAVSVYPLTSSDYVSAYPSGEKFWCLILVVLLSVSILVVIPPASILMVLLSGSVLVIRILQSIPASCWYDVSHIRQIK